MRISRPLIVFLFCLIQMSVFSQGFTKIYGGLATDIGSSAVQTPDGGFAIASISENFGSKGFDMVLMKADFEGKFLWAKNYGSQYKEQCFDVANTNDGGLILAGYSNLDDAKPNNDFYIVKTDANGNEKWSRKFGTTDDDKVFSITATKLGNYICVGSSFNGTDYDAVVFLLNSQGQTLWTTILPGIGDQEARDVIEVSDGYVFAGTTKSKAVGGQEDRNVLFTKVDKIGVLQWFKSFGEKDLDEGNSVVQVKDGGFLIVGRTNASIDVLAIRTGSDGAEIWTKKYGTPLEDEAYGVVSNSDDSFTLVGNQASDAVNVDALMMNIDASGNKNWTRLLGKKTEYESFNHILATKDGGYFMTGTLGTLVNDVYCVKTNGKGVVSSTLLKGKVFFDKTANCKFDAGETPLSDWLISITDKNKKQQVAYSKANGEFNMPLDTGTYEVSLLTQNSYWKKVCQTTTTVVLDEPNDTVQIEFPVRAQVNCPSLEVNIGTSKLTRCTKNVYNVSFCNRGTETANNAYIIIELDEFFEDISIGLANTQALGNNRFKCNLANVPAGICGNFLITAYLDKNCNKTVLGQSHSVSAHIYPDSICTSPNANWDGSSMEVSGKCQNNEVIFTVKNIGKSISTPKNSIVIEDDLVFKSQNTILGLSPNATFDLPKIPATGKTYRVFVDQAAGHPGNSSPTFAVEGCGATNGTFSTGYVLQFNENDGDPFVSTSKMESTGAANKNDKIAFPKGFRNERFIADSSVIDYQISFKNTTGKTVEKIAIIDTISNFLEVLSLYEVQSSHPYVLTFPLPNVMQFNFDNIFLPDSSKDATACNGFVKFKLKQKNDKPDGTVILNKAAIYFSGANLIQTNTVKHTTKKNFKNFVKTIETLNPEYQHLNVKIYPNPFADVANIVVEGENFEQLDFELFDLLGQKIRNEKFDQNQLSFQRNGLNTGIYLFTIREKGKVLKAGRIVIQ